MYIFLVAAVAVALQGQSLTTINLSHDLVSNGIAKANMTPDSPALDSRPLFEAAIAYANSHRIPNVIADRGRYYFLTQSNANQHVNFSASNLTIDFQYSDLYFANGNAVGLVCNVCSGTTLENFTMDYIHLPFTQVKVTSVNPTARTVAFQTIPGWPDPSTLNSFPAGGSYLVFIFRNGQQVRQTAWIPATGPFNGTSLQIGAPILQGASGASLAAIQPGDTMVVTYRNGGGMLYLARSTNATIRNVTIYSSAQFAFDIQTVTSSTFDQLQVIPRPGTDRLISANADGIHISTSGANNVISNSTVRRACDDALAIDGQWFASVNGPANGTSVDVTLIASSAVSLAPGMQVDFIDIANAGVMATATITAVNPPVAQQVLGKPVTLTLDQMVTGLKAGFGVMPSDPSFRGGGSVIRNNLVQEEVFDRGVYIPGVKNVTVSDNFIDTTNNGGIVIGEDDNIGYAFKTGPASGVTIRNNVVNNALEYGYPSMATVENGGAIFDYVVDQNYAFVSGMPDANVTIDGNLITNTPRSGVRLQSVNGGSITANTIINSNLEPKSYIDQFSAAWGETLAQIQNDFAQPIVVANSTGVATSNNSFTGTIVSSVSDASGGLRLAPGSIASAYGHDFTSTIAGATTAALPTTLGGVTVTVTDNTGTARKAGLFYVSPGQINYQVPPGTAPGVARVAVGGAIGGTLIGSVAPGLFSANGNGAGVAAANAIRVAADGAQTPVALFQCGGSGCAATPMSLGSSTDTLIVELFGTGISGYSAMRNVVAQVNGVPAQVLFAGPTQYTGLDQVNIVVPASVGGAGEVPVTLMVDGQSTNAVTISVQ